MRKTLFLILVVVVTTLFVAIPCKSECNNLSNNIQEETTKPVEIELIEPKYTDYELDLLSRLVNAEAGSDWLTDEHQRAVASVVLNRVADSRFPNTIYSVIYQRGQYSCTWNGMINKTPTQRAIDNARYVLENGITIPPNVIFQAQFKQGKGVWKYIQGHYFCY